MMFLPWGSALQVRFYFKSEIWKISRFSSVSKFRGSEKWNESKLEVRLSNLKYEKFQCFVLCSDKWNEMRLEHYFYQFYVVLFISKWLFVAGVWSSSQRIISSSTSVMCSATLVASSASPRKRGRKTDQNPHRSELFSKLFQLRLCAPSTTYRKEIIKAITTQKSSVLWDGNKNNWFYTPHW